MNDNYNQRFGIGFILAMIFVLIMFHWTFPARDIEPRIAASMLEMNHVVLAPEPTVLEEEKKKIVKKVELKKANIKLVNDVKIEVDVELEKKETVDVIDSSMFKQKGPIAKVVKKTPIKKIKKRRKKEQKEIFRAVEEMPRFGDCEVSGRGKLDDCSTQKLLAFIGDNIKYPTLASEIFVEGRVIAEFIVETDGSVSHVKILRDIGAGCGEETIRVLKKMPKWKPGRQQGIPVRVKYILPVLFMSE